MSEIMLRGTPVKLESRLITILVFVRRTIQPKSWKSRRIRLGVSVGPPIDFKYRAPHAFCHMRAIRRLSRNDTCATL